MISEHSAVVYDYTIIFDKSVVYSLVEFEKDPYDAWLIEEDLKIVTILPGMEVEIKQKDLADLKSLTDNTLTDTEKPKAGLMSENTSGTITDRVR